MTIHIFKPNITEDRKLELAEVRKKIEEFSDRFNNAINANPQNPSEKWELLSLYSIDELLCTKKVITIYDFLSIEYLVQLYFACIGENPFLDTDNTLQIAENNFIKYTTHIGKTVPGLSTKYKDLCLKAYYDLHLNALSERDAKFYKAVFENCPSVIKHCRELYPILTTPKLRIV